MWKHYFTSEKEKNTILIFSFFGHIKKKKKEVICMYVILVIGLMVVGAVVDAGLEYLVDLIPSKNKDATYIP